MQNIKRETFLRKLALLTIGSVVLPRMGSGNILSAPSKSFTLDEDAIIDLHCHPSLKMYLWNSHMWRPHLPGTGTNLIQMQDDMHQLKKGFVRGMVVAHYLVEAATEQQWDLLKKLFPFINRFFHKFSQKLEHEDYRNFDQINQMMDILESQIKEENSRQTEIKFVIARSYKEFKEAVDKGEIPIAHAIEGGHGIGRNLPISTKRQNDLKFEKHTMMKGKPPGDYSSYTKNLDTLKARGLCMMTLAHFFKNDLVSPVDGVSPDGKKFPGMAWQYTPDKDAPLSDIGRTVVRHMLKIGIVVDLTHTTPMGRNEVFTINQEMNAERVRLGKKMRPLVFTHVGAQAIYDYYDMGAYPYYKYYDVSDEEIDNICECDGVIGVIPENFWLVGADTHMKKKFPKYQFRYCIAYIIETMKYINSKTRKKDFSNIAIGTDFDGLADASKDMFVPKHLGNLINTMKSDKDFTPDQISAITWGNAKRLLKDGWGV